jgi:two-component system OmpR family response regulator
MTTPPARVLIADDVPELLQLLRNFLTEQGYEVATAATGVEALNAVPAFQPDVILLDIRMPELSGVKVLDALRRAGLITPVIAISARPPQASEGFFATIEKPFSLAEVARLVAAALGESA